jgi:hypothetical protein
MRRFFIAVLCLSPVAAFAAAPCKYQAPRTMQISLAGVKAVQIEVHSHNLHLIANNAAQKLIVTGHACTSDNAVLNSLQASQKLAGDQLLIDIGADSQAPSNLFGSSYAYLDINMQLPARMPVTLGVARAMPRSTACSSCKATSMPVICTCGTSPANSPPAWAPATSMLPTSAASS